MVQEVRPGRRRDQGSGLNDGYWRSRPVRWGGQGGTRRGVGVDVGREGGATGWRPGAGGLGVQPAVPGTSINLTGRPASAALRARGPSRVQTSVSSSSARAM